MSTIDRGLIAGEASAATVEATEFAGLVPQWKLVLRAFRKHRLAIAGLVVVCAMYFVALFAEFFAPYALQDVSAEHAYARPQRIHFIHPERGFSPRPFVYRYNRTFDPDTFQYVYAPDPDQVSYLSLFVRGEPYQLWGRLDSDLHLFGTTEGTVFLFGTDKFGLDVLSKLIYSSRISLSIGLLGVAISLVLGLILGGISGYFGGAWDYVIQRAIEILNSFPKIPLWIALSASLPITWPILRVYFAITVILSIFGWTGLARVVRGKLLALREEDFVVAARLGGARHGRLIFRHLVPLFASHIIATVTLAIPLMIIGETALSFLGVGLRPPVISWGVMLQEAQNVQTVALYPWLFAPTIPVVLVVLAFNFVGEGLRDAADPYKT